MPRGGTDVPRGAAFKGKTLTKIQCNKKCRKGKLEDNTSVTVDNVLRSCLG